jgi:uncharacterized protein YggE
MRAATACWFSAVLLIVATGAQAEPRGARPIRVSATGYSKWLPSHQVELTITTGRQQTQAAALDQNNAVVAKLAQQLTGLGVKKSQVKLATPSSGPDYEWADNRRVDRGFLTTQRITVTVPGSKTGLAGAVNSLAGITVPDRTQITSGEGWSYSNDRRAARAEEKAELQAYRSLMKKAQKIAGAMGVRIDPTPLSVNTTTASPSPRAYDSLGVRAMALESAPAATPVQVSRTEWQRVQVTKDATFNIRGRK